MKKTVLFLLACVFPAALAGCGAPSPQPATEAERQRFHGGSIPPEVVAKIKARRTPARPTAAPAPSPR